MPKNKTKRNPNEKLEHVSYEGLSSKWISAIELKPGDIILLASGKYGKIKSVKLERLEKPETTYNFEVADFHTYYVGENGVLVHNNHCWKEISKMTDDELAQFWDKGNFNSSLDSLNYHYEEHILKLKMGNEISKARYTYDALSFAERNASALKFVVPKNPALQAHFTLVPSKGMVLAGMNGQFTSSGKILTFWYNSL